MPLITYLLESEIEEFGTVSEFNFYFKFLYYDSLQSLS